jgi:hypothetical protein
MPHPSVAPIEPEHAPYRLAGLVRIAGKAVRRVREGPPRNRSRVARE